ncbi:leucine-rich repeat-containing protein 43 [Suncus etruscus]|uniref:leucine-rich repeat-containing protein 43 n=1 Tax=Suncus etruscus TaxID=109475 RepID=UPI002110A89B|nr:leucine-rich repeat-containing protein 43 [Suncus etruscus]
MATVEVKLQEPEKCSARQPCMNWRRRGREKHRAQLRTEPEAEAGPGLRKFRVPCACTCACAVRPALSAPALSAPPASRAPAPIMPPRAQLRLTRPAPNSRLRQTHPAPWLHPRRFRPAPARACADGAPSYERACAALPGNRLDARAMEQRGCTVSQAVQEHLRQLCLHDFPCGLGSWNRSRFAPGPSHQPQSPQEEPVDALLGLACSPSSPWALPEGASAEDRFLKELAIRKPRQIKDSFFYSYFKSLRVVDKKVSLVDKELLRFVRLEELILSANQIQDIHSAHLPRTLKVLELYGNQLSSLECLCEHPPPLLQHLGVGHNQLLGPSECLFLTAKYWPHLVSLDLSFNNLMDLEALMAALRSLQHLRLLVLQGNPLALVAHYRGFTIDSLASLCVLDDLTVSPSEKYQFRGLGFEGGLLENKAQIVVTVGAIRGLVDCSLWDPEPGPHGPFITYGYYVTYDFVEDEESVKEEFERVLAEIVRPPSMDQFSQMPGEEEEELEEEATAVAAEAEAEAEEAEEAEEAVEAEEAEETEVETLKEEERMSLDTAMEDSDLSGESTVIQSPSRTRDSEENDLTKLRPLVDLRVVPSPGTVLFSTEHKPYADVISYGYQMLHSFKGLAPLKTFLLSGTTVTVVEEKILSWHVVSPPPSPTMPKKDKGDKKGKQKDEGKDAKKEKDEKSKGPQMLTKKKVVPKELRQDAPILRVLGRTHVPLEPLVAGEPTVSTVVNLGVIRTVETDRTTYMRSSRTKSKKGRRGEADAAGAGAAQLSGLCLGGDRILGLWQRCADAEPPWSWGFGGSRANDGRRQGSPGGSDARRTARERGPGGPARSGAPGRTHPPALCARPPADKGRAAGPVFDDSYRPEPLTVELQVQLNQFRSAEEALRSVGPP